MTATSPWCVVATRPACRASPAVRLDPHRGHRRGNPCAGCGALAYDEVLPTNGSRGGRGSHGHDGPLEPCRITVCRICGHEEGAGRTIMRFGSADDEPDDETAAAERRARARAHQRIEKWYSDKLGSGRGRSSRVR